MFLGGSCMWRGDREAGDREKRGCKVYGRCTGGGKQEKKGKIMQHCAIFCNKNNAKRGRANEYRAGTGIKGDGKQEA